MLVQLSYDAFKLLYSVYHRAGCFYQDGHGEIKVNFNREESNVTKEDIFDVAL